MLCVIHNNQERLILTLFMRLYKSVLFRTAAQTTIEHICAIHMTIYYVKKKKKKKKKKKPPTVSI